ncbi:MAG: hypothetical protein JWM80_5547 [Cyanobacteria bacterium RYN_339]|nr:hypothetical protein [Cyanobacteria bacterium RYN_339]
MQQKLTWIDAITEATLADDLARLEDDQEFLEQYFAVSALLGVLNQTRGVVAA